MNLLKYSIRDQTSCNCITVCVMKSIDFIEVTLLSYRNSNAFDHENFTSII